MTPATGVVVERLDLPGGDGRARLGIVRLDGTQRPNPLGWDTFQRLRAASTSSMTICPFGLSP